MWTYLADFGYNATQNKWRRTNKYYTSSLYVCMAIKHIIVLFVETPRKKFCSNKFMWCFHKQNYYKYYTLNVCPRGK